MMIVMKPGATQEEVDSVVDRVNGVGARAHVIDGEELTVIGAIGDAEHVARLNLEGTPGVDQMVADAFPESLDRVRHAAAVAGKALWEDPLVASAA